MKRPGIALQLYTLREATARDFKGTLRKVAEMGYEGVEFAGYGGIEAEEMRELLEELRLQAVGSHVGLADLRKDLDAVIRYNQTIGSKAIVCPGASPEGRDESSWKQLFEEFGRIGAYIREQGLQFAYHNHAFEFEHKVGEESVFDALFSSTSPETVLVELDVCWVQAAGLDPVSYMEKYRGRLPLLHLKDFTRTDGEVISIELGQGEVDMRTVIAAAENVGVQWLIVEQEHFQNDPVDSAARCIEWLKNEYVRFTHSSWKRGVDK